ncbi:MAG TPA: efflux RND transporter periplasmic adaptor subunit [Candidatus Deferrimicrobiaceae bacterium]|jgi:RND family efflux transporter MFP subunit|nr:efflux RND transporter periplasmic adaptor subunit [Candidatus Deferrimicrobiaceae bacterium]
MNRAMASAAVLFLLAAGLTGCSAQGENGGKGANTAGRPLAAVETARAALADMAAGVDVTGNLSPKYDALVKSEFGGTVAEVYVTEWVRVKKGAPLARVDTREAEAMKNKAEASLEMAKAALLEAEAAGNRADREDERAHNLKEVGLVTQQNLDDARTQKEAAAARVSAARAQVRVAEEDIRQARARFSKAVIRAPFDGVVAERMVNVGEVVGEMQKELFRVVDNRLLDLTVTVPSSEMGALRVGQPLTFFTDAVPGRTFTGKVKFINPAVDESNRSVKVVAEVENRQEVLKGGLFVTGRIVTGKRTGVLQAPRASLLSWDVGGRKASLFVVTDNVARLRQVGTGVVSGDGVEIVSGLSAGEMVITRGGFNVRDGDRVKATQGNGGA